MRNSIKNLALGLAVVGATALTACMGGTSNPVVSSDEFGTVVVQARTSNVNQLSKPGLGKSAVITLDELVITLTSDASDDSTITLGVGDSGFVAASDTDQTISLVLNLKALRTWTITVKTFDTNDSLIQTGTDSVVNLLAGQVRALTLNANPLFTMYKATFNFPDSIYSPSGLFGQKLDISKIELAIDEVSVAVDSQSFNADSNYVLTYDYVSIDADSITINVYGKLPTSDSTWSDVENLLYTKTRATSSLSTTSLTTVPLDWEGPVDGGVELEIKIGKVGLFDVEATTDSTVLSKK